MLDYLQRNGFEFVNEGWEKQGLPILVTQEQGNWFLSINGCRLPVLSVRHLTDYLEAITISRKDCVKVVRDNMSFIMSENKAATITPFGTGCMVSDG